MSNDKESSAAGNDKESSAAGMDNRAPMLEENDYESWKIRMKRYIQSKPQGKAIWKSIVEGPVPHPMTTDVTGVANVVVEAPRPKRDEEFTAEENARDLADIQAASFLVKEELFDEYERFCAIGKESIHEYFIRFHKLANDLNITKIKIPTHQQNIKFLNNLPSYGAKYVTSVKQNQDISTKSYVKFYTYLKAYEPYALKNLKKQGQSSSSVDPLAYLAHSSKHQTSTTVASPTSTSSSSLAPEQQAQSGSDALMATMQQLVNLLSGFQKQFPPTNNQLRTSSNPRSTKGNQGYGKKTYRNSKKVICYNYRDAKDRGVILDAEAEAFLADVECTKPYDESLALTTTIAFQVSHEDAYDSDIDDGPHAAAAFMANLSSIEEANGTSSSKINELEGHIKSNKDLSRANESLKAELAQCKLEMQSLERNKVKHDLDQAIVKRNKWNAKLEQENSLLKITLFNKEELIKALNEKNKKVVSEKKDLDERNLEEIVCLQKANRVMSDMLKTYQQPTHTIPMLSKRPNIATSDLHKTALGSSNPKYGNIARESHPAIYDEVLVKEIKEFEKIFGELDDERENWVAPAPKPRKKQVTFREPPRPSDSTTQKTSDTQNHSTLPAKHEKMRRVEDHHRNLNKQNHVDSHLNVKRTGFVSNSNTVCNACNESLVFANLDNCVVRNLKSVNAKTPTAKHNVKTTKKVWKAKVVTVRFTNYKLSNRKAGSKGIFGSFELSYGIWIQEALHTSFRWLAVISDCNPVSTQDIMCSICTVIIDPHGIGDFKKIDSPFQQTSSLKPYVSNVILEKIIIDLEDEVVNLLEKEKANLETIKSLKSKGFESSETAIFESENQNENDSQVVEKECDKVENPKVIAPGMFKLSVPQTVSPMSMSKTSCEPNNVENLNTLVVLEDLRIAVLFGRRKGHLILLILICLLMCDLLDDNNFFIFDDESVKISPVSKMPFRKKPHDSMNVRSKSNMIKSLPRTFLGTVRFGNNDFAVIAGYGDVVFGLMTINKVYYVEGLGHNLFSVGKFCDKGLELAFQKSTCFVRNEDGVDLLIDDRSSNSYTIALDEVASNSLTCLLAYASSSQSWLWHQRISHLNFTKMNNLVKNNLVQGLPKMKFEKDHLCSACEQGKIHRKHHKSKTAFASNKPFYLLYMDLCGPMCVQSINGKRYVLVVVDNSRYTWVFFLYYKAEASEDVGKLKAKGDIRVFVGYSKESAAFRIYNKQTRKIHESVNVNFDEISKMASKQFSLEPGLSNLNETGKSSNPSVSKVE
nr:retrovirus-related Pol polyprotein from transposon TNT 1-94 [Tanacetum cinerariifolium]